MVRGGASGITAISNTQTDALRGAIIVRHTPLIVCPLFFLFGVRIDVDPRSRAPTSCKHHHIYYTNYNYNCGPYSP